MVVSGKLNNGGQWGPDSRQRIHEKMSGKSEEVKYTLLWAIQGS